MKIKFLVLATWVGIGWISGIRAEPLSAPPACGADNVIFNGTRGVLLLDGDWQALPIAGLDFTYPPPEIGWKTEKVPQIASPSFSGGTGPYCLNLSRYIIKDGPLMRNTNMAAWFKRDFDGPAALRDDQRALLVFKGMSYKSRVWLNGQEIGGSLNGLVPVSYDVTSILKPGSKNELVIGLASREALIDLKNRTFLAPAAGANPGIWDDVELQIVPSTRIDDVFIKPSVKNKRVDIDVTVVNDGREARSVSVEGEIVDSHQDQQTSLAPVTVTINPGESRTVTVGADWVAPHLWSPQTPVLYFARLQLREGEKTVDTHMDRFGVRDFEIRGKDFYLNGVRTVLLRTSMLDLPGSHPSAQVFFSPPGSPFNVIRLHAGFDCSALLDHCDELGFMAMPESGWYEAMGDMFPTKQRDIWLPNVEAYLQGLMRLHRNHPSIIIWNLTNETMWGDTSPEKMEVADALLAVAKAAEPSDVP